MRLLVVSTRQISVEEGYHPKPRTSGALRSSELWFEPSAEHKQGPDDANARILRAKAGGSSAPVRPIGFRKRLGWTRARTHTHHCAGGIELHGTIKYPLIKSRGSRDDITACFLKVKLSS